MICGHGQQQKFKYPYPRDSKIIQMLYPRAKTINQNPALCLASPRRLDIDRCISLVLWVSHSVYARNHFAIQLASLTCKQSFCG